MYDGLIEVYFSLMKTSKVDVTDGQETSPRDDSQIQNLSPLGLCHNL